LWIWLKRWCFDFTFGIRFANFSQSIWCLLSGSSGIPKGGAWVINKSVFWGMMFQWWKFGCPGIYKMANVHIRVVEGDSQKLTNCKAGVDREGFVIMCLRDVSGKFTHSLISGSDRIRHQLKHWASSRLPVVISWYRISHVKQLLRPWLN
jgi:hypothetical protein